MSIEDKVVAITGGSSGIGRATARLLAARGAAVILGARREERLAAVASEISAAGGRATKNAVRTITEALRQEAGPNLRVTEVSPGFVATDFAESMTDPAIKAAIQRRGAGMAIPPDAIARGILFAIEQPGDIDVGSIVIQPTAQD